MGAQGADCSATRQWVPAVEQPADPRAGGNGCAAQQKRKGLAGGLEAVLGALSAELRERSIQCAVAGVEGVQELRPQMGCQGKHQG